MVLQKLARLSGFVRTCTICLKTAVLEGPNPQIAAEPLFWPPASLRRCLASKTASSSQDKPTQLHIEEGGLKSRLYNRPRDQAASFRRPRLLGGDPLARARLVEKAALGISDERGHEQDNTPKKMRKEKPPRGHPDRKPRHAGNPRRVPDMFRITNWRRLIQLTDHHHDFLDWKKLGAFLARTMQLYSTIGRRQQQELRESGLLERLKDRAEELDLRTADAQFLTRMSESFRRMEWDPGAATAERIRLRAAQLDGFELRAAQQAEQTMRDRMELSKQELLRGKAYAAARAHKAPPCAAASK